MNSERRRIFRVWRVTLNVVGSIHFSPELEAKLERLAAQTGRSVEEVIREAVADYVEEQEDGERALEILRRNEPTIPFDEVKRRLGLED